MNSIEKRRPTFRLVCEVDHPMSRLSQPELSAVADGLRELYAQSEIGSLRETLVRIAARLVPCDLGSYNEIDRASAKPIVALRFPDFSEWSRHLPAFVAHFADHPITRHNRETGQKTAVKWSDIVTQRDLMSLPIYREYYRPMGIRHQMVFFFDRDGDSIQRAISLTRSGRDFSERDRTVLNLLQPHYAQAFKNVEAVTSLRVATCAMEQSQRTGAKALLLVDPAGRIEWLSNLSRSWLRDICRVDLEQGARAPEPLLGWVQQIRALHRDHDRVACGTVAPLRIMATARTLTVDFVGEDPVGNFSLVLTLRCAAVSIIANTSPALTRREREVLEWIARGKSNPEISTILGLSVRTVYKHVENIFCKLDVDNRAAAMLRAFEMAGNGQSD